MFKKAGTIAAVNALVLLGALWALNFGSILAYKAYKVYKRLETSGPAAGELPEGGRTGASLPNYREVEWADAHFREFGRLRSQYRSYIGWRRLPFEGKTINIDEQGLRRTPQSNLIAGKPPLVVFLGGSTMWGTGSDDANTIPALFAEISQGEYRVLNLGETNYNAFQGYLFLKLLMMKGLRPRVVVTYDGVNELGAFRRELAPFSHAREHQIRTVMQGRDRVDALSLRHFFTGPLTEFLSRLKAAHRPAGAAQYAFDLGEARVEGVANALLESWLSTKSLAEEHGARFLAILQPNAAQGRPYLGHLELDQAWIEPYRHLYPAVRRLLRTPQYRELSRYVVDMTDAFDGEELIYVDFCHVSPNGNRIIAERIYRHLHAPTGADEDPAAGAQEEKGREVPPDGAVASDGRR